MIAKIEDTRKLGIWYSEDDVFDYGIAKYIGASALLVYFALCRHANREGKAFPSVKLLTQECGLSNRVVAKSTCLLKQVGLIEIERHKNQHNVYYINSIKDAITLNGWKKISGNNKPLASKHVTKGHKARDETSRGHVTKGHEARDETSHKGHTTKDTQLKETYLRTTTTTRQLTTGETQKSSSQSNPTSLTNVSPSLQESTFTQQHVKNLHKAHVKSTPEHVKNLHEAGIESTHKGNPIKEYYYYNDY